MKNLIILGSGRSGTSLMGGILSKAGYFMGHTVYGPDEGNPKGYYESQEVNDINEILLQEVVPKRVRILGFDFFKDRPVRSQLWLSRLDTSVQIPSTAALNAKIEELTSHEPYCLKDPRFSYTLPVWKPFFKNIAYICVFREPAVTAVSILKEARDKVNLKNNLRISFEGAVDVWKCMYRHILDIHRKEGDWLFLHFEQLLQGGKSEVLNKFTGAEIDLEFADRKLNRSKSKPVELDGEVTAMYAKLCELADYHE